jgi:hypothetical protein
VRPIDTAVTVAKIAQGHGHPMGTTSKIAIMGLINGNFGYFLTHNLFPHFWTGNRGVIYE